MSTPVELGPDEGGADQQVVAGEEKRRRQPQDQWELDPVKMRLDVHSFRDIDGYQEMFGYDN